MLQFLKFTEQCFVVISLFFYTGAIAPFVSNENLLAPLKLVILPNLCLAISLLLICYRWQNVLNTLIKEKLLWILLGVTIVSPLWSDIPIITLENLVPLVRVTVFGVYFATRYSLSKQLQLLAWTFGASVLLSLLFGFVLKSYGVVGMGYVGNMEDVVHTGSWRGIYVHKTYLGTMMTVSALVFLFNLVKQKHKLLMSLGIALSVFVLLCSTTKAALAILVIALILIQIYRAFRWKNNILLLLLTCIFFFVSIVIVIIGSNAETLLLSIGRDITISGRTDIWPLVIEKIMQRPWLGYGYLTFWSGEWESEVADIWRQLKWGFEPPHAHNGFLEICLSSGLIGLALYTLSFVHNLFKAFSLLKILERPESLIPIIFLTITIFINLTESYLMRGDIYWLFYVSLTLTLNKGFSTHVLESYLPWLQINYSKSHT